MNITEVLEGRTDTIENVLKSAPAQSLAFGVFYLGIVVLITTAASLKGICGDGDFRPPCGGFAFGVALDGALAIGAIFSLVVLIRIVLRRRVPRLLKASAILYASALLLLVLPVWAAGNKLGGAIVIMMVLPISILLLAAALICLALWAGRALAQRTGDIVGNPGTLSIY